jgi:hypothetical protein
MDLIQILLLAFIVLALLFMVVMVIGFTKMTYDLLFKK